MTILICECKQNFFPKVIKIEVQLSVPSIEDTVAWYEGVLGWTGYFDIFDDDGKCSYGSVFRGENCFFNLNRTRKEDISEDHRGVTFYIHVEDVNAVYRKVVEKGCKTSGPPETQIWGGRIFTIKDINGFYLMFLQMVEDPTLEEIRERMRKV